MPTEIHTRTDEYRVDCSLRAREQWANPEKRTRLLLGQMGHPVYEETRKKISDGLKGKGHPQTSETRARISRTLTGRTLTPNQKRLIGLAHKGLKLNISKEVKERMRELARNRTISDETREKLRVIMLDRWQDPEYAEHISRICSETAVALYSDLEFKTRHKEGCNTPEYRQKASENYKKNWNNLEYRSKIMSKSFPNKPEKVLLSILDIEFPNEWIYVGNGTIIIGGKCPDFANVNGKKAVIELYGEHWHTTEDANIRIRHFEKFGYNCLIVWSEELKDIEKVKEKLSEFMERI